MFFHIPRVDPRLPCRGRTLARAVTFTNTCPKAFFGANTPREAAFAARRTQVPPFYVSGGRTRSVVRDRENFLLPTRLLSDD